MNLTIIDELKILLDPLDVKSYAELERSILAEGVRDAIVVWKEKSAVIDGHNRYEIAKKNNIPFKTEERSFPDIDGVKNWIIRNQIGRRNLTPDRFTYFLGKIFIAEKMNAPTTAIAAATVAADHGVSPKTVLRAESVTKGIDLLSKIKGINEANKQLSGDGVLSKADVAVVGKAKSDKEAEAIIDGLTAIAAAKTEQKVLAKPAASVVKKAPTPAAKPAPKLAPAPTVTKSSVAFIDPNYDSMSFSADDMKCPDLAQNAVVYIVAPDAYLDKAIYIAKKWGFAYDGTFIFTGVEPEEGVWSKINHISLVVATRGTVAGPAVGKEAGSVVNAGKDYLSAMHKIINQYHPSADKIGVK